LRFAAVITTALIAIGFGAVAMAADIPGFSVHTPWKRFCFSGRKPDFKSVCDTRGEARKHDDHSLLAAVELIEREGQPQRILRVTVPLGMQLKYGTRLIFYGVDPRQSPYVTCTDAGCMSDYEATPALVDSMRAGGGMAVQAINQSGKPLTAMLSLADFRVAYDGRRQNR
jgi:invasion protein IalB